MTAWASSGDPSRDIALVLVAQQTTKKPQFLPTLGLQLITLLTRALEACDVFFATLLRNMRHLLQQRQCQDADTRSLTGIDILVVL